HVRVRSADAAGNLALSDDVTFSTPDGTPPSVSLTAPAATTVSGAVTVSANAADNVGVAGVQFRLDGANLGVEITAAPYSLSWNTATSANGSHTVTAVARDAAGNQAVSAPVTVSVSNDATSPTVSMTAPAEGATVSGTATLAAAASDDVGVAGVQFAVDGANFGAEITTAPYSAVWDTSAGLNGAHTLTAIARDAAGNRTTSAGVTVTVNNDTTPPVLSGVVITNVGTTTATIGWTTDEAADSQVEFGLTTGYGSLSALDTSLVITHSVSLSGLAGGTLYHARVRSHDAAGNLAVSADTTLTTGDATPPTVAITAPSAGATISGTAAITATATDNVGVAGVLFSLDGVALGPEITTPPYTASWNTQGTADLIFGAVKVGVGGMTIGAGTGTTRRLGVSCPTCTGDDTVSVDAVQSLPGPAAAVFTFSAAAHYLADAAAFKATTTPMYLQGAAATSNTAAATISQTFAAPVSAGSLIIAAVAWSG